MTAEDLIRSRVVFDEIEHTYTLDGKELSGITPLIEKFICPGKYDGVPERNIEKAGTRGSKIHGQIQMIVDGFSVAEPMPETTAFFDAMSGTEFIAAEYLLDYQPKPFTWVYYDKKRRKYIRYNGFASAIDIIDNKLNLYDVKTTAKLDIEYVRWQLSIYAYLFERQNPTLKAGELYVVWLNDCKFKRMARLDRIPDELVVDILNAYADNLPWSNPLERIDDTLLKDQATQLARLAEIEDYLADFKARAKAMEDEKAKLTEGLLDIMEQRNVKTYKTDRLTLTRVDAHTSPKFDSTTFKKDYPQMYERYVKESNVKRSLRIAIK